MIDNIGFIEIGLGICVLGVVGLGLRVYRLERLMKKGVKEYGGQPIKVLWSLNFYFFVAFSLFSLAGLFYYIFKYLNKSGEVPIFVALIAGAIWLLVAIVIYFFYSLSEIWKDIRTVITRYNQRIDVEAETLIQDNQPNPKSSTNPGDIAMKIDPGELLKRLKVPESMMLELIGIAQHNFYTDPDVFANGVNYLAKFLPPHDMVEMTYDEDGIRWGDLILKRMEETGNEDSELIKARMMLRGTENYVANIYFRLTLPEKIRNEHMHIIAGSGHGKTQLLQSMILDDIDMGNSVVVIDSQRDMIKKLLRVVPEDKLVYIDPTDEYAPAINLFGQRNNDEQSIATAVELYEYIFSALDTELTTKQATVYRFVSRLMMTIPNATIHTMREVLEQGLGGYAVYLSQLNETAQAFFRNQYETRNYNDTRAQILQRLYTVLENETFARMFGVTENKIDLSQLLDTGHVVLVNTAKSLLKAQGASLLGRFWIARVAQAVFERTSHRQRTYLYIDEAVDYLSSQSDTMLSTLFSQGRKYELGLILAHQYLSQLPPQIADSIHANTAIKLAGGLSASDCRIMAGQMRCKPEDIDRQRPLTFLASFKNQGCYPFAVERGKLEEAGKESTIDPQRLLQTQRAKYRVAPKKPVEQDSEPQGEGVEEQGEW